MDIHINKGYQEEEDGPMHCVQVKWHFLLLEYRKRPLFEDPYDT